MNKNIFALLKTDHKNVKSLLNEVCETSEKDIQKREQLFNKIKKELMTHNEAEEKVFYDKLNANRKERVLVYEGKDEHHLGGQLLDELQEMDKGTEEWSAKIKVLKDLVEHHIYEEEHEVHAEAKKEFSTEEANQIGEDFLSLKEELASHSYQYSNGINHAEAV